MTTTTKLARGLFINTIRDSNLLEINLDNLIIEFFESANHGRFSSRALSAIDGTPVVDAKYEKEDIGIVVHYQINDSEDKLQLLRQHYYYTTWKADGTRYTMLITGDGCYLIDRKFVSKESTRDFLANIQMGYVWLFILLLLPSEFYMSGYH
ncbi:hypothetical protein Fmac_020447 [Flemingia macrophylla]|uniref:mRNA capping enzyme adenylation domain-containing protein n=1 Tax=Flemingia macrophylla TaxID=520843 RepID=A0ABD1LVV8_9FABA